MANYFTIDYESAASSPGYVEVKYGNSETSALTVNVSLHAGASFTPTHYKMWGVELVEGEGITTSGTAEWLPFTNTRDVLVTAQPGEQYVYAKFKNASEQETEVYTSNAIEFSFTEPTLHGSTTWQSSFVGLNYDDAASNTLLNDDSSIEVEINKNKIDQLYFSDTSFQGLSLGTNTISVASDSYIGKVLALNDNNHVSITKTFESTETPLIMVDDGTGYATLTAYDGSLKSTLSGVNATRVSGTDWNSGTKTLAFDAYAFSTYSFGNVSKVEFTSGSQTGGYVGSTAEFSVYVQDSAGEGVETAPVTISGISGNIGTIVESMPVYTDATGIASFTLNVSSTGSAVFRAIVDDYYQSDDDLTIVGVDEPASSQRSLLTQYEQIRRTATYDDTVSGTNTAAVAEPSSTTFSGSSDSVLEHDLNVIRTIARQIKGTSDWFSSLPTFTNPANTNEEIEASLSNIANNTLDSRTILSAVSDNNSAAGFDITPGDDGFLFTTSLSYATPTNRLGLPIYHSTTNSGSYHDEGADDLTVGIDLIDLSTGGEYTDVSGNTIYAKFHDGVDYSGSGDGTDVYVKFYTSEGEYTTTSGDPSSIMMVYPYRRTLADMQEYEWVRTDFVSSWEGDEVIVGHISDLWSYTGASDGEGSPTWTSASGTYMLSSSDDSLQQAIDTINTEFGDRIYTEENYITTGESITDSLDTLDMSISDGYDLVGDGVGDKYVEVVASDISAGVAHQIPVGLTYTPDSTAGQQGSNMDVYLDGQLLSASTGANGVNEDRDYSETSTTHITFHFKVHKYSNITYVIRS